MRAQFSMIELLLIVIALVVCISLINLSVNQSLNLEAERAELFYRESLLNSFLSYDSNSYNETFMTLIIHYLCSEPFDLSEALDVLNQLNYRDNSFILYASLNNELRLFNHQSSVCLDKLTLSSVNLVTSCGNTSLLFGVWEGEAPQSC